MPSALRPLAYPQLNWSISGMECGVCALDIEHAVSAVPGVRQVQVNALSGLATVELEKAEVEDAVRRSIVALGYDVAHVDAPGLVARAKALRKDLFWRMLLASFCMMQVMMYSFPEYLFDVPSIGQDNVRLLRWAQWMITLPVMLLALKPVWKNALRGIRSRRVVMDLPSALGLLLAFFVSSQHTWDMQGPVWFDSVTMFATFLLLARWLSARHTVQALAQIEKCAADLPQIAHVWRDGQWQDHSLADLRHGDLIQVLQGERLPCDGEVQSEHAVLDVALIQGESTPHSVQQGEAVPAGAVNVGAVLCIRATRVGADSTIAQLGLLLGRALQGRPQAGQLAEKIAPHVLVFILGVAAFACAAWWVWTGDWDRAVQVSIAVLIVTCPCALSLAGPTALSAASSALARQGVLLKNTARLEHLRRLTDVVLDKTGTLTTVRVVSCEMTSPLGEGPSLLDSRGISWRDLAYSLAMHSTHPASVAVADHLRSQGAQRMGSLHVKEFRGLGMQATLFNPLSSDTFSHTDACPTASHLQVRLGSPAWAAAQSEEGVPSDRTAVSFSVWMDGQAMPVCTFVMDNALRPEAQSFVKSAQASGLRVHVLSGDQPAPVNEVAHALGIRAVQSLQSPQDKVQYVQALQAQGAVVGMVGDGLNDAAVLACADMGFAVSGATQWTAAQADALLLPKVGLNGVLLTRQMSFRLRSVVQQNLGWAFAYNVTAVPVACLGALTPGLAGLGMAVSSAWVTLNAMRLLRSPH